MKNVWMFFSLLCLAAAAGADSVTLTDGSSLSGEIKEQANGDLVVVTGAGEITVEKGKIARIVKDGDATATPMKSQYVEDVEARRAKYGNSDGIPRTQNLQQDQLALFIGQLNYTGDAFSATASDLAGLSYGLAWAHSYTDYVAMELWGDYSYASKEYTTVAPEKATLKLQRFNVGAGPRIQKAVKLSGPESSLVLIPSLGVSPVWSSANGSVTASSGNSSFNSSSFGASFNGGLDLQFGGALISARARYLVSTDVSGSLKNSNTSAFLPQLGIGFSF